MRDAKKKITGICKISIIDFFKGRIYCVFTGYCLNFIIAVLGNLITGCFREGLYMEYISALLWNQKSEVECLKIYMYLKT